MVPANIGEIVARTWMAAVASYEHPDFMQMWVRGHRHHINTMGAATRPVFGLLTPTTLTDAELMERM